MKTIAISIDEATLEALATMTRKGKGARGQRRQPSRSEVIREAVHDFIERRQRLEREARERRILARHRQVLAREAAALVGEQAEL
jgi:metal-responsive CopG/Arc/MetJ family transcriptional regulator